MNVFYVLYIMLDTDVAVNCFWNQVMSVQELDFCS